MNSLGISAVDACARSQGAASSPRDMILEMFDRELKKLDFAVSGLSSKLSPLDASRPAPEPTDVEKELTYIHNSDFMRSLENRIDTLRNLSDWVSRIEGRTEL